MPKTHAPATFTADESAASLRVIEAVADAEGVDATTLDPPLFRAIDPNALDRLIESADEDVRVSFQYLGHTVSVDGGGTVALE